MAISTTSFEVSGATELQLGDDTLHAEQSDGRRIAVPLAWYPRLLQATPYARGNWVIIAGGQHLHWPDPNEDISVKMLLTGRKSGESQTSLHRWREAREAGLPVQQQRDKSEYGTSATPGGTPQSQPGEQRSQRLR